MLRLKAIRCLSRQPVLVGLAPFGALEVQPLRALATSNLKDLTPPLSPLPSPPQERAADPAERFRPKKSKAWPPAAPGRSRAIATKLSTLPSLLPLIPLACVLTCH